MNSVIDPVGCINQTWSGHLNVTQQILSHLRLLGSSLMHPLLTCFAFVNLAVYGAQHLL